MLQYSLCQRCDALNYVGLRNNKFVEIFSIKHHRSIIMCAYDCAIIYVAILTPRETSCNFNFN